MTAPVPNGSTMLPEIWLPLPMPDCASSINARPRPVMFGSLAFDDGIVRENHTPKAR